MIERYKLYYTTFLVIFWTFMCWGFVVEELLPGLSVATSIVFLLIDVATAALGLLTIRKWSDILVGLLFALLAIISTKFVNHESTITLINGFRDFIGIIFVPPILRYFFTNNYDGRFTRSFNKQLKLWLIIQAFCITWQFFRYGAGDHGGGSLGNGWSGMTSMMIYWISFYLITRDWDSSAYFASLKRNKLYAILLFPTYLNETKISFILLILYFLLLIKFDRELIIKMIYIIPSVVIGFITLGIIYLNVTDQEADELLSAEFYEQYMYGLNLDEMIDVGIRVQDGDIEVDPRDWWIVDIPRLAKLVLIGPALEERPGGVWLGAGVGHFKGGSNLQETTFSRQNKWLLQGSRPELFFIYTELGFAGLLWFFIAVPRLLFTRGSLDRYSRQIQFLLGTSFLLILIYNDMFRFIIVCVVMFYISLSLKYFEPAEEKLPETQS